MNADAAGVTNRQAWDRQASLALATDRPMAPPRRVEWTQYPGHGPGTELLGDVHGQAVVELGCGSGDNLAPLAAAGAWAVGVDISPAQVRRALTRWSHLRMRWHCADARDFLVSSRTGFDICLSIFGAVGLCPPEQLLPLIARRLRPGGRLVFSVPHPEWLGRRRYGMRLADGSWVQVARWVASRVVWVEAVRAAGFRRTVAEEVLEPTGAGPCCILVTAQR